MSETPDTQDLPPVENEQQKKLSLESLSDEQLNALADAWKSSQGTETPMADLRATLTDTGLFDFASKYNTDNIELRSMATAAQHMLEHRQTGGRRAELDAILAATKDTVSFEDKRTKLVDLYGTDVRNMSNADVDHLVKAAQDELDALNATRADSTGDASHTNQELADGVSDLLDGQLTVDVADRVHYGAGATASGKNVGGKFVSQSQLRDVAAHADEIRDGLAARNEPGKPVEEELLSGDEIDEAATMRRYEAHTHADEAPAEGGDIAEETSSVAPEVVVDASTLDGDEIDEAATMRRYEAHTHPDEAPAEGGDFETNTTPPVAAVETPPDGDEIDQDAAMRRFEAHNHEDEAPAEGGDITEPVEAQPLPTPDLNIYTIDQSEDAKKMAKVAAFAKRREVLQTGGRFKRFVKNLWMGENGVAGPYMYRKYYHEMLEQIEREGDILAHESNDRTARRGAQVSTVERFEAGYLHEDAGEQIAELEEDSAYGIAVKDLIRRYAEGDFADEAAFMEERGRILLQLGQDGQQDLIGEGSVRIDNMFLIAEQVKAMADHGDSIDRILEGMKVYSGEARSNVRTEAHLNMIDRVIDRLDQSRGGGLVTPTILGATAAVALGLWSVGRGSAATAIGMTVPGVMGGVFAGLRENKRLQDDRMIHAREMAMGKEYDANAERRVEIEGARYETVPAQDLITQLNAAFEHEGAMSPQQVQQAYEMLAMIESRVKMSDQRKIDLISFSEATQVEVERQALDIARAQAKVQLAAQLANLPPDFRANLGITDTDNVDAALNRYTDVVTSLESDISAKDKTFNRIRVRRIAAAAAAGAATSLFIGLGAQELVAFANPSYEGLAEHLLNPDSASGATKQTVLEGMFHGQQGFNHAPTSYNTFPLGTHGNALELPAGYTAVPGANGSFSVEGANGTHIVDNLTLNKNGSLTPESLDALRQHNVSVNDMGRLVTDYGTKSKTVSVDGYNKLHAKDITHITRDFWNDNDTPSPKFDHNELGLSYGGEHGTGVGANGSIRMSVAGMTEGGSWHGSHHVSWEDAAENGKLKLAISGSRGTQAEVYMVDIKPNGSIKIPADSPAAKFFSVEHGHVKFHGGFIEAVETRGTSHGVTHVAPLATVSGDHSIHHIVDQVPTVSERYVPHLKLTPPETMEVVGFAGPEIVPRTPLEKVYRRSPENPYNYYYGNPGGLAELEARWREERSPRLKKNPDADLNTAEEIGWYMDKERKRRGKGYIDELEGYIDKSDALKSIDKNTKAVVCIPVAAASESENIYRTLSFFANQDDPDAISKTVVLLNVNWKESLENDPASMQKIQKTLAEIKRAQADFPHLKIGSFEKVWPDSFVKEKNGKIYGEVIKVLYDTAAEAVNRSIAQGKRARDDEALLITNDADTIGMSRNYLHNYIKTFEANPKRDAFTALVRRGTEAYKEYPGYGVVSAFYAVMTQTMIRRQAYGGGGFSTDGPNSGIRMSMYAAMGGVEESVGAGADGMLTHRMSQVRRSPGQATLKDRLRRQQPKGSERVMGSFVPGAGLDTVPDRLLGAYKEGKWIAEGWNGFDSGGYESREDVLGRAVLGPEDPEKDIDSIAGRIETSVMGFANNWWRNPGAVSSGLALTFGMNEPGRTLYDYSWAGDKFTFKFTNEGKNWLKDRLLRDGAGNPDAYGHRLDRQLYGKVEPGAVKQPVRPKPVMLS